MDANATPEQLMLRDAARAFLESRAPVERVRELATTDAGYDPKQWARTAELGWFGLLVPESHDGAGLGGDGVTAAAIVAEERGRALHPGPFVGVSVVAEAISRVGSEQQQHEHLPPLTAGTEVATWAMADAPGDWDASELKTVAARRDAGWTLSGNKRWVQDAAAADHLLVSCRSDEGRIQLLVPADAPGVTIRPLATMDLGCRMADVELAQVEVGSEAVLGGSSDLDVQLDRQLALAVVLQCADSVGAASRMLEITVDYARQRIAFGRPIGSFQAVKHLLADAATWLEASQAATWAAVRAVAGDASDQMRAVHIAKMFVGRHCPRIVEDCMQVHGGIAMTWEHDSHLYLRRLQSNRMLFGTPGWHADRLCTAVGMVA